MDFAITEEQSMLVDSVARFIDNDYDFERRMKIAESDTAFSRELWQVHANLGWTAMLFDEDDGGLGGGPVELMLIMEQFGRGLVVEPFVANVVLAGGVLKRAANTAQKEQWLAGIIDGSLQAALAFVEPQARFDALDVRTTAAENADGWVLNGRKSLVLNGGDADLLIVPARTSESGLSFFALPADCSGLTRKAYKMVDAQGAAELLLDNVTVGSEALVGARDAAAPVLSATLRDATFAACAEASGIMRILLDKTVDYSKQRVQFGVPIGSFQALQHRMVDMLMACEQTRSLLLWCAMSMSGDADEASRAVNALKYQVGTAGRKVAEEAVQLHGGMGVTWELDIAHYFKRITSLGILFGNADYHLDRYCDSA